MMRQIVIHRPGSYDRLTIQEAPDPLPGPGEVVVATQAIGVNYADCIVRMGLYESARKYVGWPITPGFEFAGTVQAIGAGVCGWTQGQAVLGVTRFGGYSSHVAVPAEQIFPLPAQLKVEEGAALPVAFLTAYYALVELCHPRPGERILVHSAAGGVGGALLQLGRVLGCVPIGVVGAAHKVEVASRLGASAVIDKSHTYLWREAERHAPGGYDIVLDANGAATLRQSYRHLASPGKLVVYGFHSMLPNQGGRPAWLKLAWDLLRTPRFNPLLLTGKNHSVLGFNLSYLFARQALLTEALSRILGWVIEGRLVALPVTSYPLARVADAHRDLESGRTTGKLVLIP